ncbi:hypothetical protein MOB40_08850 [Bacillus inaquosorum]|uniref:hypothetical protein n=1 Tax=Bacillus inaquosorum TaxID=483913 RepID=UPI0009AEAC80|nr:hypothetical protein [Bacillus inaquosorum]AWM16786.1 hypothetical protein DKG76_08260 [Bacillus inaquosorum]MCY7905018.1 hypothetical protein [Bacillus inaquosorum]MCY7931667.1 hypothetical protein [Bacillus inaquosorum]MCY8767239.1 hypothetical protein [Bacillus inaquosorum]MCY9049904.1 hypothetical protein [Bacillus inaquosorum]
MLFLLELFSHYVLHFERYFILSRQSTLLIQWSIVVLAGLYLLVHHPKINRYRTMFLVGVLLRIVLLAGVSVELIHQVQVTNFSSAYLRDDGNELLPLLHFLLYGYVLLTAFHYMLVLRDHGGKGMFYTFDLAVVSLPIVQMIFSFFSFLKEYPDGVEPIDFVFLFLIIILPIVLNVLFFKLYWRTNKILLGLFYTLIIGLLVLLLAPYPEHISIDYGAVMPYTIYLTMAGFLMSYHLFQKSGKVYVRVNKWLTMAVIVFFILLLNPIYNVGTAAFAVSKPANVHDSFNFVGEHISSEKAEQILKSFFPTDETLYLHDSKMDVHYFYSFESMSYEAEVDEVSQLILNYQYLKKPRGKTLTDQEYVRKSVAFLERHGRVLNKDHVETAVSKEDDQTVVHIFLKNQFHKKDNDDEGTVFYWEKETLMGFGEDPSIYQLNTLQHVHITERDIHDKVKEMFAVLNIPKQPYQITDIESDSLLGSLVQVETKDGIVLDFESESGSLQRLSLPTKKNISLTNSRLQQQILSVFDADVSEMKKKSRQSDAVVYHDSSKTYEFFEDQGMLNVDVYSDTRHKSFPYTYRDGKLAYEKVAAAYRDVIYKKRMRPIIIQRGNERHYAWLIIIQPFGSNRHDAYVVDGETQEVKSLYES